MIGQGNGTTGAIAATNVDVASSTKITATTGGGAKAGDLQPVRHHLRRDERRQFK